MTLSNRRLIQIAVWGGLIVSSTGFYLQSRLIDKVRDIDYYRQALKALRTHAGAIYYLGEPIKDKRFKITDAENNCSDEKSARFCVPVSGPKERGSYYFWAQKDVDGWTLTKAELELKSKPDARLVIIKQNEQQEIMFVGTSKEKFFYHNTLLCLVQSLQGNNVTIDLRNDSYVCGYVSIVDGFMNITFEKAVYCDPQGHEYYFEQLFIQGRSIRYVHIPEDISILSAINQQLYKTKRKISTEKPIMKSRKASKALKQHMETVALLNK